MRVVLTAANGKNARFRWSRFWRFLSFHKGLHRHNPALFVEVNFKRLIVTLGLLVIIAYLAGTAALAYYWGNRPHSPVTYGDVVWPGNWSNIRPKQGQMLIAQAEEAMKKEKYREAFFLLRSGLRMYPADQEARLTYARMLASSRMLERAGETLAEGLDYGYPENEQYLQVLLQIIATQQNQELLARIAPKLLETEAIQNDPKKKTALLKQYLQAQFVSGDYLGALATVESLESDPDAPFQAPEMAIAANLRMGATEEALNRISALSPEEQAKPSIRTLKAATYGVSNNSTAMLAELRQLFRQYPADWPLQLSAIKLMLAYGKPSETDAYIELYVNTHISNPQALSSLVIFLTDRPDSVRVARVLETLKKLHPQLSAGYEFFLIQALLTEGHFTQARKNYESWVTMVPKDHEDAETVAIFGDILIAVTDGGAGARNSLMQQLRTGKYPPEIYWEAALALARAGFKNTAIEVINVSTNFYPSQPSLLELRKALLDPNATLPGSAVKEYNPLQETMLPAQTQPDDGRFNVGITEQDMNE